MGGKRKFRGTTMVDIIEKRVTRSSRNLGQSSMPGQQSLHEEGRQTQPQTQLEVQPQPPPPPQPQPPPPPRPQPQQEAPQLQLQACQLEHQQQEGSTATNDATISVPSIGSTSEGSRRGRGGARPCLRWGTSRKLEVHLGNNGKIVGLDKMKLQSTLGVLARNGSKLPLTYPSFSDIPPSLTDDIWEEVQDNTTLHLEAKVRVLMDVAVKWKDFKSRLKTKYFAPFVATDNVPMDSPDSRVSNDQWKTLVAYWKDQNIMEISERNKKNRALLRYPHRTGRICFDEIIEKMRATSMDTSRLDVFLMTRMPKAGKSLDADTKTMVDAIRDAISRVPESDVTTTFKEKLLGSLVGGEGRPRMRCLGTISAPNAAPGSSHLAPSSSNATPISLESIPEGLMQMIIDKVGEYVLEKARAEARDEVAVALENFFQTIVAGANNDPNRSSVRAEGNASTQVADASSVHKPNDSSR
ncbi:uncharacterized protein LOC122024954 isoform X1 [Zingiber officinale]|uniref:uncharacterized protein LOC121973818 isoform X1 n=2 Tax=Zingiber officinale TaxID=94328 RepID=UPI001C4B56AB|nr:uncharacterized protein LOC121973818 isoform X1 [Zingiber officinale]XP_042439631.1 uncharacterized protein LOC122024954 isoform X1 [Zingiber officinale]